MNEPDVAAIRASIERMSQQPLMDLFEGASGTFDDYDQAPDQLDELLVAYESATKRIREMESHDADLRHDLTWLTGAQYSVLVATINVLRGDPPPNVWWSTHDVADVARTVVEQRDAAAYALACVLARVEVLHPEPTAPSTACTTCRQAWPCATAKAVRGES